MKKYWWGIIGIVVIALAFAIPHIKHSEPRWDDACTQEFVLHEKSLEVCVANTDALREQGLSNTPSLAPGKGMLFEFEEAGQYGFWMKDMNYPIDIIWIDENLQEVFRAESVPADSYPKIFNSPVPAKYVLETNPGEMPLQK